ncbi:MULTISPECIES: lipopolysaccharide assembly protein LapA domain-containing protein [Streptomyces]|uniref:Lipopolysaccharide assembly protein LapA domain-containing protein n=1 Tax=Streptomyces solicathayae TaxID=3081768 RepID=A0ABZ0LP50_9ACTN|nr:lipopolysaccharide assembly protein LapA domain-containing protein [Streptomyces sp. HUAS YS2]WOX21127.1 lipopolysaccharide assembly protein LapA domain-containing protein [Streptomyces sp. HUAS YS2]
MGPKETAGAEHGGVTSGRIAIAVLVVLTLVLIFENTTRVEIRLLVPEVTMPLYLALLGTALLGAVCGWYGSSRRSRR